ncbi:serine/threonine-protein kinase [Mycobacterium sp. ML4]
MTRSVDEGNGIGLNAGDVFAGYTIDRLLGRGGMGQVYLARHPRLPRREALKILNKDISVDTAYRKRFIKEADVAAALWHPNIVRINDRGEFSGQLWLSMDFVDGTDAASLLRKRYPAGLPANQVAAIVMAIASALDHAHRHHEVLHRDVSPANILLAAPGTAEQRILLADFGIARSIDDVGGLTATNMTIGTFPYAAPEQLTDEPIDGRADQYALAATAYHLLTGSTLFPHTNPAAVISRHLSTPPPALADTRPALQGFDPVFAKALAKNPAERYIRCSDFADAFVRTARCGEAETNSVCTMPRAVTIRTPEHPKAAAASAATPHRSRWRLVATAAVTALAALGAADHNPVVGRPTASPQPAHSYAAATLAPPPKDAPAAVPAPAPVVPRAPVPAPAPVVPRAPVPAALHPKTPAPQRPQRPTDPDQTFVNTLTGIPGLTVTDPATAAATGRAICKSMQNGGSPNDSVQATMRNNSSLTPAQAAAGVNAAITVYCPQYSH